MSSGVQVWERLYIYFIILFGHIIRPVVAWRMSFKECFNIMLGKSMIQFEGVALVPLRP